MISFDEAFDLVLKHFNNYGEETIALEDTIGRVLAQDIKADRDFPPFDRVTKDGIPINFSAYNEGLRTFKIQEIAAAGDIQKTLRANMNCIEVMTGAMLPVNTDTVIMYEEIDQANGNAIIQAPVTKGQNIHSKGKDRKRNEILVAKNSIISTSTTGILATVGCSEILVKRLPKVAIISTGNELVEITSTPKPHEIRSSNSISLRLLLKKLNIESDIFHIPDEGKKISEKISEVFRSYDILMMSGGVSMGKFDLIPNILDELGSNRIFHRVAQRPGKPFWFGRHKDSNTTIFSFPGNPVSTFVNFHIYFIPWINASLSQQVNKRWVTLNKDYDQELDLTRFALVKLIDDKGHLKVELIGNNGSGDLVSLGNADGVIKIPSGKTFIKGDQVEYISFL